MEKISFKDDLLKYIVTFLVGLAPVLLLDAFVIDRLSLIFNFKAQTAFEVYQFLYFSLPFLLILLFHIVIQYDKKLTQINIAFIIVTVAFFLLSIFGKALDLESYNLTLFLVFLITFLYLVVFGIRDFFKRKPKENLNLYGLLFEFGVLLILVVVISSVYISNNENSFSTVDTNTERLYKVQGVDSLIVELKEYPIGSEIDIFAMKDQYSEKADALNDKVALSKTFVTSWSRVINYHNYRGVSLLMIALACWIAFWGSYGLQNLYLKVEHDKTSSAAIILKHNEEDYTVQQPVPFRHLEILTLIKSVVTIFAILITPLFYASNTLKDPNDNPHINLGRNKLVERHVIVYDSSKLNVAKPIFSVVKPIADTTRAKIVHVIDENAFRSLMTTFNMNAEFEKYLYAIWQDQQRYNSRIKGQQTGPVTVLTWNTSFDSVGLNVHPLKRTLPKK